jgi:hypothetical protein
MAATKRNAMNIAEAREKIRTTQIINRLQGHIDGKVNMVPSQVTAALGLLKKAIPDLAAQTDTDGNAPKLTIEVVQRARNSTPA